MAAIDRLVHHALILEFDGESIRVPRTKAKDKAGRPEEPEPNVRPPNPQPQ
jgi:hypothetical protein